MAISMLGCASHGLRPATIDMASTRVPADLPPISPPLPAELTGPRPCTLHGTGFATAPVSIALGESDPTPRAVVYGNLTTGAEWNDVPPPGAKRLARFTYTRSGVRIHAYAPFEGRSFWLAQKAPAFDGVAWIRPNRRARVTGVDSGEAIVEIDEDRIRPSLVSAHTACEDLGTDETARKEELPLPGTPVHLPRTVRWLHLRAQPGGPIERDVGSGGEVTKTTSQSGFVFIHVRHGAADLAGWVAASELKEHSGGYGIGTIGHGAGIGAGSCAGTPERHVVRDTALRVGPSSMDNAVLGDVLATTSVIVRNVEGRFAKIDLPPCEITPAKDQAFWVDTGALD